MPTLLWDQHICLPLQAGTVIEPLTRYKRGGGAFVSVNAGYSPHSFNDSITLLAHYRAAVEAHPDLELAADIDDVSTIASGAMIRTCGWPLGLVT